MTAPNRALAAGCGCSTPAAGLVGTAQVCDNRAMKITADITLDTRGMLCPEPVMMLHNAVRDAQPGQVIELVATDPSTTRDIPKFCNFLGHELISQQEQEKTWVFLIRKG